MISPMAKATTRVDVPAENQPPFYARIGQGHVGPGSEEIFHNDQWAAIPFYRDPATVPQDFNLLNFFDFRLVTGQVVSPLTVDGFEIWDSFPPPPAPPIIGPLAVKTNGLGAVPIWFVSWPELQQEIADGQLTVPDLSSMLPRKGSASFFTENLYPMTEEGGSEVPGYIAFSSGRLEDGSRFRFEAAGAGAPGTCCSSDQATQYVNIEFDPIPEPSSFGLLLLGLAKLTVYRRHRALR
jgi:hypothetical protein